MGSESNEYREQRLANMRDLEERGYPAYGRAFKRTATLAELRSGFEEDGRAVVAGRLMTVRKMGSSIFADLRDGSDRFQIFAQKKQLGNDAFNAFKRLDIGDMIGVEGSLFTTKTGEKTVNLESWTLLAKSLLPLPEKWHGLRDIEARYRQRYLDLITNPDVRELFNRRTRAVAEIRSFLVNRGFLEVETPMIQAEAGGAAAKPFTTHYDALGQDMYLRVAPELYLKRLLVGGFDKVFELNRNFRNEGLSRTHNPEFTMLEIYEAYSDVNGMKVLIKDLITHVAETVYGTLQVGEGEGAIELGGEWREATYHELVAECMGDDWFDLSLDEARARAEGRGLPLDPEWDMLMVTHEVYEKLIEKKLVNPTFVTRLPAVLIPLARTCADDDSLADVFELVISGQEVAPAYTELNNALEQRGRLVEQAGEDLTRVDDDFLTALEHGMPPAGGMGVGVDRLIAILSGVDTLKDIILFPQLKPRT